MWLKSKVVFKLDKPFFLLLGLFVVYLLGFITSSNFNEQFEATTKHLSYVIVPLSLVGFELTKIQIQIIKKTFIWSTITFVMIAISYGFWSYFSTGKSTIYINDSVQSKFMYYGLTRVFENWHPTYVSFFCNVSLVFVYQVYFKSKKYIWSIVVFVIFFVSVFLLNSFIGIVSLAFLGLLFLISLVKSTYLKVIITILTFLFSLLFYHSNPFGLSKIEKLQETKILITDIEKDRNILNLRIAKWQTSLQLFKEFPLFGVSAGDYNKSIIERYKLNGFSYIAERQYAAHNQYIYTLASSGIIGLLFLLAALVLPIMKQNDVLLFTLVFSLFCLTEDMLLRQQGVVAFSFFYILLQKEKTK